MKCPDRKVMYPLKVSAAPDNASRWRQHPFVISSSVMFLVITRPARLTLRTFVYVFTTLLKYVSYQPIFSWMMDGSTTGSSNSDGHRIPYSSRSSRGNERRHFRTPQGPMEYVFSDSSRIRIWRLAEAVDRTSRILLRYA